MGIEEFHTSLSFLKASSAKLKRCVSAISKGLSQDIKLPKYFACGVVLTRDPLVNLTAIGSRLGLASNSVLVWLRDMPYA